jgi:D-lactate dehydrogenase
VALDVYEQEADVLFEDLSDEIIKDDVLQRLLTFPNVLLTGHQAFLTGDALTKIAQTTLGSITAFARGERLAHRVAPERLKPAMV